MINILKIRNKDTNVLDQVVYHEVQHLFHISCPCRGPIQYGLSYSDENLEINPLLWMWFVDASAEKDAYNLTREDILVYQNMIGYLESISMATILNPNVVVHQTEKLSLTGNMNRLFEQLGATTEAQKLEIIQMMFTIEILQNQNEDFHRAYEQEYGIYIPDSDDELLAFQRIIKTSICETLSKVFYNNLANAVQNNSVTLEDVFYLISVFEAHMNRHTSYHLIINFKDIERFLSNYIDIQNAFFGAIANSNNLSTGDVINAFDNYAFWVRNSDGNKTLNHSLNWLLADKTNYIYGRQNDLDLRFQGSIRIVYEDSRARGLN